MTMTLSAKDMVRTGNMNNEKSSEIQDFLNTHTGAKSESSTTRLPGISEVLPSLYLCGAGVAIPCFLEKLAIKCVINIAPELPDTPLPDDRPLYYQIPVLDKGDIDLKCYFDEAADLIESIRQSDGKSLVHCVAGVSRSASICIAYLIKHCDMTLRDAFFHVREVRRSKSKERKRSASRSRDRKRTSRSPRRRSPKRRSRSPPQKKHRSPSPLPFRRGRTPPNGLGNDRSPPEDLSPEERDARTVFCMQLSQRIRSRDIEEFFSSVGKVRDIRLITCNKTKRFKGIAYIEFKDPESVPLALGLSGQRLLGIPICVQHTQAEKNRMANTMPNIVPKNHVGPMRLYVGSLHFNITEDMLRGIFEPFGKIDSIQLIMDPETNRSKGYGFITFHNAEDAKKALEQLNGFELAGRPMKVGNVTERLDVNTNTSLDTDEMDRSGIDLGATGRLQLMFKLAEGAGLAVPQAAANALLATAPQPPPPPVQAAPSIATQCFLLSNMFDPATESNPSWDTEITDDVIEECKKHGGILHVYVDKSSQGNVYVKCPSIATAVLACNSLHDRWFAGRVITAAYVPLVNYHSLFPDALTAMTLLNTTRKS